jgi:hypothetical protein
MIGLIICAYLSERINSRVLSTVVLQLWALPLLIALYTFDQHTSRWVYYTVVSLITGTTSCHGRNLTCSCLASGYPYVHPIQGDTQHGTGHSMLTVSAVAWASRNSYSVGTRTITASVYNMCVQAGSIIYVSLTCFPCFRLRSFVTRLKYIERVMQYVSFLFGSSPVF